MKALKKELRIVEKKIDGLLDLWNDGTLDKATFTDKFNALKERKEQLQQEIPRLEGEIDFLRVSEIGKDHLLT